MALLERKQYQRRNRRRTYKKRQRTGLFVFIALVVLTFVAWMFLGTDNTAEETAVVGRVSDPTVAEAPEVLSEEEVAEEEPDEEEVLVDETPGEAADEDEVDPIAPDDTTMRLSIPALGVSNALVLGGDAGLELGAQHVSGFPWQDGANTYIAGHRIGFPGSGSDHIFYSLPFIGQGQEVILEDALGQTYTYRITETFAVSPTDLWVLDPVPGRDVISLQVCTETPDDWATIGPSLFGGGPESGRMIARADRVA